MIRRLMIAGLIAAGFTGPVSPNSVRLGAIQDSQKHFYIYNECHRPVSATAE
jgi:hypothetical protein